MTAEILKLVPTDIGEDVKLNVDQVIESCKGKLTEVVVIGVLNGEIFAASSEGPGRALWLVEKAKKDILV